jgi:hypothetical protein
MICYSWPALPLTTRGKNPRVKFFFCFSTEGVKYALAGEQGLGSPKWGGILMEKKITNETVLEVLKRIGASGRMTMVVDLIDEFDCAAAPKPILDALRVLRAAGLVGFKEPLFSDSAIRIIDVIE